MPSCHRSPGNSIDTRDPRPFNATPWKKEWRRTKTARQFPGGLCKKWVGLARLERGFGFDLFLGLGRRLRRDRLEVDLDLDVVAEQEATCLQRLVPGQVEVLAVHPGVRGYPRPTIAPGYLAPPV